MRRPLAALAVVALLAAGYATTVALGIGETSGTVTAAVPDRVVTIPGTTVVQTYTIPTVTQTVTVTTGASPPPPPPPAGYPPTSLSVHHFWVGIFTADAFNYAADSAKFDDFIAHGPDTWTTQGARFKQYQPNGHALLYQNFGAAGDGISTVLSAATARANGWTAHDPNGNEILCCGSRPVVDFGKPGVKEAYAQALNARLAEHPWDGVFADDVNAWGFAIQGYSSTTDWIQRALVPLFQYLRANVAGELRPNLGDWPNSPGLDVLIPYTSGAHNEWYLTYNNAAAQTPGQIEHEYASMRSAISAGKVWMGITHRTDLQGLKFAFCAAAIMGGDRPDLVRVANQQNYGSTALTWDGSLTTQLGAPTTPVSHATGSTAWSRSFANGYALTVNTQAQTCTGI